MIEKTTSYKIGNQFFGTIEAAQIAALNGLIELDKNGESTVAELIMEHKDAILDILTTTASSKPSARKINGGTKKRKAAAIAAITEAKTI